MRALRGCAAWLVASLLAGNAALAEPPTPRNSEIRRASTNASLTPSNPPGYQRLMSLGLEEYDRGHWAEARALFLRGHALAPSARTLRALGMTAFNLRRYPDAVRELQQALDDPRRPLTRALRDSTQELLDRADTFVGRYYVRVDPAHAQLRVDGLITALEADGALPLAVGEHVLELQAPGYAPLRHPLLVDGSDGNALRLTLWPLTLLPSSHPSVPEREEAPSSRRGALKVLGDYGWTIGLGIGSLGCSAGAIVLHSEALKENERLLNEECAGLDDCQPGDGSTDRRDDLQRASAVVWVGAALLAVSTLVLALVETKQAHQRDALARAARR